MEKLALFFFVVFNALSTSKANNHPPLVRALYIFGDSIVDAGNNEFTPKPCGIDLKEGESPARFTNGKTLADFIALSLGLPLVPPVREPKTLKSTTGMNFAFSASNILPESENFQKPWALPRRIELFNNTVCEHLTKTFGKRLNRHLKESIFLVSIGINDYANGRNLNQQVLTKKLLNGIRQTLTALHGLGARKFLVNNIWPIGCAPVYLVNNKTSCNETLNQNVLLYDKSLPGMLKDLQTRLPGTVMSHSDNFRFLSELKSNTAKYGITNFTGECNPTGKNQCEKHVYFDGLHMSQATNFAFAQECFKGTICSPNIATLVKT